MALFSVAEYSSMLMLSGLVCALCGAMLTEDLIITLLFGIVGLGIGYFTLRGTQIEW